MYSITQLSYFFCFFFLNDTATTEIYTLPLHDALPIYALAFEQGFPPATVLADVPSHFPTAEGGVVYTPRNYDGGYRGPYTTDRKSTRLNSSHSQISYAVFCLKKKKT